MRRLLQERDVVSRPSNTNRSCQTAEAGPDDGDVEGRSTHASALSLWFAETSASGGIPTDSSEDWWVSVCDPIQGSRTTFIVLSIDVSKGRSDWDFYTYYLFSRV